MVSSMMSNTTAMRVKELSPCTKIWMRHTHEHKYDEGKKPDIKG